MRWKTPLLLLLAPSLIGLADEAPRCAEVVVRGDGPQTMLIIPAMSARWKVWEGFMERNADRYTMYAVTPPGFGGTPAPELAHNTAGAPWTDYALDAIEHVIDEKKLDDVAVMGHSWGGGVAVLLAARRPDVISAIINVDGLITTAPERESLTIEERAEEANREVIEKWEPLFDDPEEWARFNGWREDPPLTKRHLMVYGMNMATPKPVVLQCWREMWIWELNTPLRSLDIPILDMRAIKPNDSDPEKTRQDYLDRLSALDAPQSLTPMFFYDTKHAIEGQRPEAFDKAVATFMAGEELVDFHPPDSE